MFPEVIGDVPRDWLAELDRFARRLARHPWGGDGPERLIVSDDLASALAEWMQPDEWEAVRPAVDAYAGRALQPGGKAFLAKDGRSSVAVAATSEKELFLMTVGHELIEAALERGQREAGEIWQGQSVLGLSHLVWSEYVVERTRTEIGRELGFEPASQETNRATCPRAHGRFLYRRHYARDEDVGDAIRHARADGRRAAPRQAADTDAWGRRHGTELPGIH